MVWPALIAAGASLGGGLLSSLGQSSANKQAADLANKNLEAQSFWNSHGLSVRANDAMKAYKATGIHPLALLGVNAPVSSPVSASFGNAGEGIGNALSRGGQDISRAIYAARSAAEREAAVAASLPERNLRLEHMQLQNDLLRSQIARLNQQSMPAMPAPGRYLVQGQGNSIDTRTVGTPLIDVKPGEVTATDPRSPGSEAGVNPDVKFLRTTDGGLAPVKAKQAQEGLEDDWLGNLWWNFRNRIDPGYRGFLPKLREGKVWEWHVGRGAYYPVDARRDSREMLNRFKRGW